MHTYTLLVLTIPDRLQIACWLFRRFLEITDPQNEFERQPIHHYTIIV